MTEARRRRRNDLEIHERRAGPLHEERRFAHIHGAGFAAYRGHVPFLLPGLKT
jgi:hypothetical protein